MKQFVKTAAPVLIVWSVIAATVAACAGLSAQQVIKYTLDSVQEECVLAHEDLPETEIGKRCGVAEKYLDVIRRLLSAHRAAMAKHMGTCAQDAGK